MMTYVFAKAAKYVACEIHQGDLLTVTVMGHRDVELDERFPCTAALQERWQEVRSLLEHEGWCGPLGLNSSASPEGLQGAARPHVG